MADGQPGGNTAPPVVVQVLIAAELATVWSFLSDGTRFASWIGAFGGAGPLPGTAIEPRVGGTLRVAYPPGNIFARGEITELEEHRRIVFTWGYEGGDPAMPPGASRVEISLRPHDGGTLVVLTHEGLPTEETRRGHAGGWTHYVTMLAREAASAEHGERLANATDRWFSAWAERCDADRRRLLSECCEPTVRLRSTFACTDSLDELSAHIANGQRQMPGLSLQPEGPVQQLFGYGHVAWKACTADGATFIRGRSFLTLSRAGKLQQVVSFQDPAPRPNG